MNNIQESELKDMMEIGKHIRKEKWNISQYQSLQLAAHIQSNVHLRQIAKALDVPVEVAMGAPVVDDESTKI